MNAALDPHAHQRGPAESARLVPMTVAWLDDVMAIEQAAYPFPWTRGNFIDSLSAQHPMSCLVGASGTLLGYVVTMVGFEEIHILNLTVAPAQQGRGYARLMLQQVFRQARSSGASFVWLEVRPSNARARELYERVGFQQVGVRRDYYPDVNQQREDALVMRRAIGADTTARHRKDPDHGLD